MDNKEDSIKNSTIPSTCWSVNEKMSNSSTIEDKPLTLSSSWCEEVETNFNDLEFEFLINNIEPKVLDRYLLKILLFLDDDSLELEFRNITKDIEHVLVYIVKDVNILKTNALYDHYKNLCNDIIKKVHEYNSGKYFLACIFKQEAQNSLFAGFGGNSKNILVYKKIYHTSVPQNLSSKSSRSSSPVARSSSLESEDFQKLHKGGSLPVSDYFKSHCLKLILDFVEKKQQKDLIFSGLTEQKADFVLTVFSSLISDNSDGGVAVKNICPQLWEAVKVYGLKYEFRIKDVDNDSATTEKFLVLEKLEKENANIVTGILDFQPTFPITSTRMKKQGAALKSLSEGFIISSLEKMNKFLKDETEASLIFGNLSAADARFLNNITNYCRSPKMKNLFCKEARYLLDELQILDRMETDFTVKFKQENMINGHKIVRFTKRPTYDKRQPVTRPCSAINFQSAGDMSRGRPDKSSMVLESEKDPVLVNLLEKHSMTVNEPQRSITPPPFEFAKEPKRLRGMMELPRKPRKTQLIEALSVPVKSDKALKMMLGMGWQGGALGSRGNGITEPIMPDLNTVAGAGLGHVRASKPNVQPPKAPPSIQTSTINIMRNGFKFRTIFLGKLLELLKSNEETKTVRFNPMLSKKEKSFLRHAMKCFSSRTPMRLSNDEQGNVDEILYQYEKDPELQVFACISADKKEVHLKKLHNSVITQNKNDKSKHQEIPYNEYADNIGLLLEGFGSMCQSQKSYENAKFRVDILVQLLKFIKNDAQNRTEVIFDDELTLKQRLNLEKTIRSINKRAKFGISTLEAAISFDIKRNMGDFLLDMKLADDLRSFTVTKAYFNKPSRQPFNTATVTSKNNKYSRHEKDGGNKLDEAEDLYMEDDIKITDNAPKSKYKSNQIVYKNREINEQDDEYANELSEDYKNSVNYPDNNLDIYGSKTDDIPRNDEEIVIEYDDGINNVTEKNDRNITDSTQTTQSEATKRRIFNKIEQKTSSTDKIRHTSVNDGDIIEITDITTKEPISTIIIDSDSSDNASVLSVNNMIEKISISDQSQPDYRVLGIDEISMSEGNLTDWDEINSDDSINITNKTSEDEDNVDRLAEFKKKHIKKKSSKINTDIKIISLNKRYILPENLQKYIQRIISHNIIKSEQFPLLKCYGVHKNRLIYSCQDKKSYDWMLDMCVANEITMQDEEFDTMSFKINWFYDVDDNYVFDMLDLYNKNISTNEWSVLKREEELHDYMFFVVKMDKESFNCILNSDLALYAGVDKIQFNIVWE